ncbi:MAG: M48 family metallopeptidase [Planctomycetes bacterium]|nr:M48 family metallopeptidase [Planctomycetota bacterium]
MDFFEHQDRARRRTGRLVVLFVVAVVAIIVLVDVAVALCTLLAGGDVTGGAPWLILVNPIVLGAATVATLFIVGGGSLAKIAQLRGGGTVVAESLNGRPVRPGSADRIERRLLNVVEEMAIASGTPTPPVYIMDGEPGINAFAAGYSPGDAVVAVTRGTAERLSRDELQGVIAHEFSHILNGDMRLNIRLIGVLHGILVLGIIGSFLLRSLRYTGGRRARSDGRVLLALAALGGGLMVIGSIGTLFGNLIKAAVSRQREFLADASAVQYTRAPHGIAGALKKIGGAAQGSVIRSPNAPQASHMFFGQGVRFAVNSLFATHPPLDDRIRRIEPGWDGTFVASALVESEERASRGHAAEPASTPASRFAQRRRRVIDADAVVAGLSQDIGRPTHAHVEYAQALRESLPASLTEAARDPYAARALLYALLMSPREPVRREQLHLIERRSDDGVSAETLRLLPLTDTLDDRQRLPLIDLTLPALRSMTRRQFVRFDRTVADLAAADETIDRFEWLLKRVVRRHVAARFEPARRTPVVYYGLGRLRHPLGLVLSTLAHAGHDDEAETTRAFAAGAAKLDPVPVRLMPPEQCTLDALDGALEELNKIAPRLKRKLLSACAACITADGQSTVHEIELARAIADTLGVPVPPVVASE